MNGRNIAELVRRLRTPSEQAKNPPIKLREALGERNLARRFWPQYFRKEVELAPTMRMQTFRFDRVCLTKP